MDKVIFKIAIRNATRKNLQRGIPEINIATQSRSRLTEKRELEAMPSRKKSKGKERKARALAKLATAVPKERVWETLAHWGERSIAIQCSHGLNCHGCVLGHPVSTFLDEVVKLDEDPNEEGFWLYDGMKGLFEAHSIVCEDSHLRNLACEILLCMGANSILRGDEFTETPHTLAIVAVILEHCEGNSNFESAFWSASRLGRDITDGNIRDTLRFFSRRLRSCSCLKSVYEQSKSEPKISICYNCHIEKERALLKVCGRCKLSQYCSEKCQRDDWPIHKKWCDKACDSKIS